MTQPGISLTHFSAPWQCPVTATYVSANRAYEAKSWCKRWSCKTCHHLIVTAHRWKVTFALRDLPGTHLYLKVLSKRQKTLSNFLQNETRGPYVCIRTVRGSAVVVATRQFRTQAGRRTDKAKFLSNTLPKLLQAPWRGGGKRITYSQDISNLWRSYLDRSRNGPSTEARLKKEGLTGQEIARLWALWEAAENRASKGYWAAIPGRKKWEFDLLKSVDARALWLLHKVASPRIFKEGQQLLYRHCLLYLSCLEIGDFRSNPVVFSYLSHIFDQYEAL